MIADDYAAIAERLRELRREAAVAPSVVAARDRVETVQRWLMRVQAADGCDPPSPRASKHPSA